ncbi:MAG: hypothetical protein Fur0037_23320 [Planctomycetota bacterium]
MNLVEEAMAEEKADMTPMIDAVFLMIIFFICIDFKILEAKLPAYLPKDKGSSSEKVEPQEQLSVKIFVENPGTKEPRIPGKVGYNPKTKRIYPFRRIGHTVYYQVGPERINSLQELKTRLSAIYDNKSTWQPDKEHPGQMKPIPIVVEPYPGTCYDDVAHAVDAVKSAKFEEVNFGGGLGATNN